MAESAFARAGWLVAAVVMAQQFSACSGIDAAVWNRPLDLGPAPEVIRLPSGLQLVIAHDTRQPVMAAALVVGAGAVQDPPGKAGLAHLVEHLTFEAKPDRLTTLRQQFEGLGGVENGQTGFDAASFYAFVPSAMWRESLALQVARLADPLAGIDEAVFQRELDVVRNELWQRSLTDGSGLGLGLLQQAIFAAEDPYSQPVGGTPESLANLTLADARAFANRYYRPANATLYVDGALPKDLASSLVSLLPRTMAQLPSGRSVAAGAQEPVRERPRHQEVLSYEARVGGAELWIGWALPSVFEPEGALVTMVAQLASVQLGSAWLHEEAPEIISAEVHLLKGVRGSLMVCHARLMDGVAPERPARVIADNVAKLWADQLPQNTSRRQRRNIMQAVALDTQESLLQRTATWSLFAHFTHQPQFFLSNIASTLRDFDAWDAGDFIREHFSAQRAHAVHVKPTSAAARALPKPSAVTDQTIATTRTALVPFPSSGQELASSMGAATANFEVRTLANGLTAIVARRAGDPAATVLLGFHGGTATAEPAGVVEIAAVSSLFAVTDNLCGSLDRCGVRGRPNLLRRDSTATAYRSDSALVPHTVEILAQTQEVDWVEWPRGERALRYRAFRKISDHLTDVVSQQTLDQKLYPSQRWAVTASLGDLEHISDRAVKAWSARHRDAANSVVLAVGDLNAPATLNKIEEEFSSWKPGAREEADVAPPLPTHARPFLSTVQWPGAAQAYVSLGCRMPPATVDTRAWQDLFAQVVGHALDRVLRRQMGITYGFTAQHEEHRGGASEVVAHAMVSAGALRELVKAIEQLIAGLGKGDWPTGDPTNPSLAGLDAERWEYVTRFALALGTSEGFARELFHEWNMGWPVDGGAAALASLVRLDPARMARFARTCHDSAAMVVAADPGSLRELLLSATPN